jgi:hypothetical protein
MTKIESMYVARMKSGKLCSRILFHSIQTIKLKVRQTARMDKSSVAPGGA